MQHGSTCLQEPRKEFPPTRGLGPGLVSLVPYLGDALGKVEIKEKRLCFMFAYKCRGAVALSVERPSKGPGWDSTDVSLNPGHIIR